VTNTPDEYTDGSPAHESARADDVRAHDTHTYANYPPLSLPTYPTQPKNKNQDTHPSPARTNGSADAHEEPPARQPLDGLPDDEMWLVGYQTDRINGTVKLLGFKPPVTETLRPRRWATLVPGEGWVIPGRYLAHVERLLIGAGVMLFDVDGAPTPGQGSQQRATELAHTKVVLDELHAARAAHDPARSHKAYREAKALVAARLAEIHAADDVSPVDQSGVLGPVEAAAVPDPGEAKP